MAQTLSWFLLLAPYVTLIFLDMNRVKRFMPVSILASMLLSIVFQMAQRLGWWEVQQTIFPLTNTTTFVYGAFLVGTLLIFYYTFPNFGLYFTVNMIVDLILCFVLNPWFIRVGIYELRTLSNVGVFVITQILALIIYVYQLWQDTAFKRETKI